MSALNSILRAFRPSNVPEFYLGAVPNPQNVSHMVPFSYVFPEITATGQTATVSTFAESDFLCTSMQVDGSPGALQCVVRDLSTNWPLSSAAVPISSIFGSASLPYYLPIPWFIQGKATVEVVTSGTFSAAVFLTLSGMRIFRRS